VDNPEWNNPGCTIVGSNEYNKLRESFYVVTGEWHGVGQVIQVEDENGI
jgi:hypothetical protein